MKRLIFLFVLLLFPCNLQATTWQDVMNAYNNYTPSGEDCVVFLTSTDEVDGVYYKMFERCRASGVLKRSTLVQISDRKRYAPSAYLCDGTYRQNIRLGWTEWWCGGTVVKTDYYCDGNVITTSQSDVGCPGYAIPYESEVCLVNDTEISSPWYNPDCTASDVLIAEYGPITEECGDILTSDPADPATLNTSPSVSNCPEICDGDDNDGDGEIDEGCNQCEDNDGDGFYAYDAENCLEGNDCNDKKGEGEAIHPGATEWCGDNIDNNCVAGTDEAGCECSTEKGVSSTANIASGNLMHDQSLFDGLILYYNSLNPYDGPVGEGWSHSYDINVTEYSDGSVFLRKGSGKMEIFNQGANGYVAQPGHYSTLSKNSDDSFIMTEKGGTIYSFNSDGKIASITDRNGNATTFEYTGGILYSIIDSSGRVTSFSSDLDGKIVTITDPSGNDYFLTYDGEGNLLVVDYPSPDGSSSSWSYTYYDKGLLESKTDPNGYTVTYVYDEFRRFSSSTTSEGEVHSLAYDTINTTSQMTNPDGGIWRYVYSKEIGVVTEKIDPDGNTTSYTYDADKNMTSRTEPDGSTTGYMYDDQGNMVSEMDAAGNTTNYTYNEYGQVLTVTDPEGNVTSYEYDERGNLTSTTDPSGATTSYEYDERGNVTKITDSSGGETVMVYDDANNLTSVTDPSGATTTFTYDEAGNMTSQTDGSDNTTTFEYNSLNQLIKVTDPQGNNTTYSYDKKGNKVSQTDANGNTTYYAYNHKGQLIKVTDALGGVTKYTYGGTSCSACGSKGDNLTSITDASGNTTHFEYDYQGRLVKEIDPLGNAIHYGYNSKWNLTSKTDAEGNTIEYSYDPLGRLLKKEYPDGTSEGYSYDVKGNILTASNQHMGYSFTYDSSNRVTSVTDSDGRVISYSYDTSGRKTKTVGPSGEEILYSYDDANRLASIASAGQNFGLAYDSLGRRSSLSYPNGVTATYSYDASGRLVDITHATSNGSVVASNSYSHDGVGNRLSNESEARTAEYTYDLIYRLTEAHYNTPGFSTNDSHNKGKGKSKGQSNAIENQTELYTYDPVGNRLTSQKNNAYSYNAANQLVTENGTTYSYDKNGNLIQKSGGDEFASYFYDYENRLIKVERTSGSDVIVVEYKYDPFGRRIEKKVSTIPSTLTGEGQGGGEVTRFFYDNEDILFEYDESGNMGNQYLHGPGIDEPLRLTNSKGNYYYHADGLGSIVAITDESAKVVQDYDYYYFGELKNQKNRIKQPYKYTSREHDRETGLYFYRARYYDSEIGRFTQFDPILHPINQTKKNDCGISSNISTFEELMDKPQNLNPYAYAYQNPINYTDPLGLRVDPFCDGPPPARCQNPDSFDPETAYYYTVACCVNRCENKLMCSDWALSPYLLAKTAYCIGVSMSCNVLCSFDGGAY